MKKKRGDHLDQDGGRGEKREDSGYTNNLKADPIRPGFQVRCGREGRKESKKMLKEECILLLFAQPVDHL